MLGGNQNDRVSLKTYPKRGYLTDTVEQAEPLRELYELSATAAGRAARRRLIAPAYAGPGESGMAARGCTAKARGSSSSAMGLALLAAAGTASAATDPAAWVKRILADDSIQINQGWAPQGEPRPAASWPAARTRGSISRLTSRHLPLRRPVRSGLRGRRGRAARPGQRRVGEPGVLVEMPKIEASPVAAGTYSLRVAMTDCASDECAWSARLYAKR